MDGNKFYVLVDLDAQQQLLLGNFSSDFDELDIQGLGYKMGELVAPEYNLVANPAPQLALPAPHPALPAGGPAPPVVPGDLHVVANADQEDVGDDEDANKYPWIFVAPRLRVIGLCIRQEIPEPEDCVCTRYVVWVKDDRSIRAMRKSSMVRKSGMTSTTDGEAASLAFGSYGPNGIEY